MDPITIVLYFVPTFIALFTDHRKAKQIFALNLLLGWTIIGWVVAFIWSLKGSK